MVGTETQSFAVNRYQMGERPSRICESVGRSRVWLRKWIGRYDNSDKNSKKEWFSDKSPSNSCHLLFTSFQLFEIIPSLVADLYCEEMM
ncbi:MAG: hypothetical protein C5S48_07030 [Candidatus Methanogaster sp.]|nr:MAG: hypothetical protein C5S48_07030 [ANME-2 cluster archaeon]